MLKILKNDCVDSKIVQILSKIRSPVRFFFKFHFLKLLLCLLLLLFWFMLDCCSSFPLKNTHPSLECGIQLEGPYNNKYKMYSNDDDALDCTETIKMYVICILQPLTNVCIIIDNKSMPLSPLYTFYLCCRFCAPL